MTRATFSFSLVVSICAFSASAADTAPVKISNLATEGKRTLIQDINANSSKWIGKEVVVEGQIARLGPNGRTFVLDGDGIFNDQILVIGSKGALIAGASAIQNSAPSSVAFDRRVALNERIRLAGKVRRMTVTEIERTYGPLGNEIVSEWKSTMPVILVGNSEAKPEGKTD